jgi:hypothetical protein
MVDGKAFPDTGITFEAQGMQSAFTLPDGAHDGWRAFIHALKHGL